MSRSRHSSRRDSGSAVVEFVVVVPVLLLVVLAVVQIGLALHVRATLASAAAEGARVGAVSGGDAGVRRTREILATTVADGVVESVASRTTTTGGLSAVDVEIHARLPLVGLLGPETLVVHGHALVEA